MSSSNESSSKCPHTKHSSSSYMARSRSKFCAWAVGSRQCNLLNILQCSTLQLQQPTTSNNESIDWMACNLYFILLVVDSCIFYIFKTIYIFVHTKKVIYRNMVKEDAKMTSIPWCFCSPWIFPWSYMPQQLVIRFLLLLLWLIS